MRILVFLGHPNPFPGAAWTRIGFLADFWSRKGHSVEVVGAFGYESLHKRGVSKLGKVGILNLLFTMGLHHPVVFLLNSGISFMFSTLVLASRRPDIVIVSVPTGDVGLGSILSSILLRKKVIVDYRDDWEEYNVLSTKSGLQRIMYKMIRRIASLMYAKIDLTVSVTPTWAGALRLRGAKEVHLIPNGADVRTFRSRTLDEITRTRLQLGLPKDCFIAIFTGTLAKYYMFQETIRAFAEFLSEEKNIPAFLLVVSNDEEDKESGNRIMALSQWLRIESRVIFLRGTRDHMKLGRIIASADVGLIPLDRQRGHVWPAKFFEYCACGLPVIATVRPDSILGRLIHKYRIGLTVRPNDHKQLKSALAKIYRDARFRRRVKERASQMVRLNFNRKKLAEEFLELLADKASSNSG